MCFGNCRCREKSRLRIPGQGLRFEVITAEHKRRYEPELAAVVELHTIDPGKRINEFNEAFFFPVEIIQPFLAADPQRIVFVNNHAADHVWCHAIPDVANVVLFKMIAIKSVQSILCAEPHKAIGILRNGKATVL